jgi:hypothetical protein
MEERREINVRARWHDLAVHLRGFRLMDAFRPLELVLCNEEEMPTTSASIPKTYEEMMKRKAEVQAKHKQQRQSRTNSVQRT